jgi:gliding motility-associated-like protein
MKPNRGQWHENIQYKVEIANGDMYIENEGFTYLLDNRSELFSHNHNHHHQLDEHDQDKVYKSHVIKTKFIGSNEFSFKKEEKPSEFYYNYFIDNDQSKWKSKVHAYSKITYENFYPGIDFILESKQASLEYLFKIQPGTEVSTILYSIEGADKINIDKNGNLIIKHRFGSINESKPKAWTINDDGTKKNVSIQYKISNGIIRFHLPKSYDKTKLLIIDPNITFSTYSGSTSDNWGSTATPDNNGNLFAAGIVIGPGYPTTPGAFDVTFNHTTTTNIGNFDVALSKFNSNGSAFLYSTYIGAGNGNEIPLSIVSDDLGNLHMLGTTSSSLFPTFGNPYQGVFRGGTGVNTNEGLNFPGGTDMFVLKLNPTGTALLGSTFLGGTSNDGVNEGATDKNYGDSFRGDITVDEQGNIYIAGTTRSDNFPTVSPSQATFGGVQDAVFAKLSPDLSNLLWSTFYGGSNIDAGYSVQVNSTGDVFVCGGTNSTNINMNGGHSNNNNGDVDGFIVRFNGSNSSIINQTYVGTNSYDQTFFIQLDDEDFVYVYGQTNGQMAISPGLYGVASAGQFVRKYSTNLNSLIWTTKVGGPTNNTLAISPTAFLVSDCKEIYFAGWGGDILQTNISNFPTTSDAFMPTIPQGDGFYIAVLAPNATELDYATFIGGPARDHVDGGTSRFDKSGRIYHAVCAACQGNANGFVSTPGVVSQTNNSPNCNLAAFKFELNSIEAVVTDPNYIICIPDPIQFFSNSINGEVFVWDFGDGNSSNLENPTHSYTTEGTFNVKLTVYDSLFCKVPDSVSFQVEVGSFAPGFIVPVPTLCKNTPFQLSAGGGAYYKWFPSNLVSNDTISNPFVTVNETTTLSCIIGDVCGLDTFSVVINVFPDQIQVSNDTSICIGTGAPINVQGSVSQIWSPNIQINNNLLSNVIVSPIQSQYYFVEATTINNCIYQDSVYIEVFSDSPIPIIPDSLTMCNGSSIEISVSGGTSYLWSPNLFLNTNIGSTVISTTPTNRTYYCDFTNACGTVRDSVFITVVIPNLRAFGDTVICYGDSVNLFAEGVESYLWTPAKFVNNNTQSSVTVFPSISTNFIVYGTDEFGCIDTDTVSVLLFHRNPVELGAHVYANLGDRIQLNAQTEAEGFYYWTPTNNLSCITCQNPIANPNYNIQYRVYFTDTNGCITTDVIEIIYDGILYIPNTFTPDDNRFNPVFKAEGEGIDKFHMTIFNRWGEAICEITDFEGFWDGTYKGTICQDGTYTWKVFYRDRKGNENNLTGHVNLLR